MAPTISPAEHARNKNGTGKVAETPQPACPSMHRGPPGLSVHRDHLSDSCRARATAWEEVSKTLVAPHSPIETADKLVKNGTWDPKGVRERKKVADEAQTRCEKSISDGPSASRRRIIMNDPLLTLTTYKEVAWSSRATGSRTNTPAAISTRGCHPARPLWRRPRTSMPTGYSQATPCREQTEGRLIARSHRMICEEG